MKKICFLLGLIVSISTAYTQNSNDDLPPEFQNVARQAFQKLSPATSQWFAETAKQHPPGKFDASWARKKLVEKFGTGNVNEMGEIFVVMIAYQKMMNKEVREDRKLERQDKNLELAAKEEKLKLENKKIDAGMEESREKADQAMTAAQTEMWIGIVSGGLTMAASSNNLAGQTGNTATTNNQIVKATTVRQIDSNKVKAVKVDEKIKMAENQNEKKEPANASADRRRAMNDAVKKLLDQIAEMNRRL